MAAFLSLVPVRDFVSVPATPVRAHLRLVHQGGVPSRVRLVALWRRDADGHLVRRWQPVADPDPVPRVTHR